MKPLLDPESSADENLRSALRSAHADEPNALDIERLSRRLESELGIVIPPMGAPPTAPPPLPAIGKVGALKALTLAKWIAGIGVAAGITGTGLIMTRARHDVQQVPAPTVAPTRVVPTEVVPIVPSSPPPITTVEVPPPVEPTPSSTPSVSVATDPRAEYVLVSRAQEALSKGHWQEALSLAAEHQRRFPSGEHAEERERIAIEGTWRSGRHEDARRRAETFFTRYPKTIYRARLQQLVGVAP
jgi:hypothetical protein